MANPTVADIIRIMERLAPGELAEKWDNSGLQTGCRDWPVHTIRIALDPSADVAAAACRENADLLITHHPLIFGPLKTVDFDSEVGSVVALSARHQMAVFSAHTNLDSAPGGVNDILADRIGLKNRSALVPSENRSAGAEMVKLTVFVPQESAAQLQDALFETSAGKIGEYSCCSFSIRGQGTFQPGRASKPFYGKPAEISRVDELRLETVVSRKDVDDVVRHIRRYHPYETMAYDVYPLLPSCDTISGLGRVGNIEKPLDLAALALKIKTDLKIPSVRIAGKPDLKINRVAICSGSGSSLLNAFFASGADVFISGDIRYHDAREIEAAHCGLIDIGHFASEYLIVDVLEARLKSALQEAGFHVDIAVCAVEKDPFQQI